MRLVDADALLEEMCEACDREACEGMGAESKRMVCYSARIIKEAPTIKEHDDKYRWHDLRKNPDGIPENEGMYIVAYTTEGDGHIYTGSCMYYVDETGNGEIGFEIDTQYCGHHCVVAWREIEPFEKGE